ncbi:predicted protein [Botrytis cinerea T4]|uniref:Uncharacterized protein n=1 Tax=Botryotinia fuckeliana (strain T4) TaxID=999810 RepID=G2XP21_BOTF4|nr:predicted protein [Botrytis cinerea T4]
MACRINIGQSPNLASNSELVRMLNGLCWAIDQTNPLLLLQNGNPHFHVIAAFALLDSEIAIVNFGHATMMFFKIQTSHNLNQYQTTRAQYALQALHIALFDGQCVTAPRCRYVVIHLHPQYDSKSELKSEKNYTLKNRRGRGRVPPRSKPPNEIESLTEKVEKLQKIQENAEAKQILMAETISNQVSETMAQMLL